MDRSVMLERLNWLATAKLGALPPDWIKDNCWSEGIREVAQAALDEIKDQERSFELRWNADMRAIKRWQAGDELSAETRRVLEEIANGAWTVDTIKNAQDLARSVIERSHPKELTWPDHADLVVWLLEQLTRVKAATFMECETCAAKPGSPTLCHGCLHNRAEIASMTRWKAEHVMSWKAEHVSDWRPIADAPILGPDHAPDGYVFNCLLQSATGIVGEGLARYVKDGRVRGNKHVRVLRWYFGDGARDSRVCKDPKYFMPLPAKRED